MMKFNFIKYVKKKEFIEIITLVIITIFFCFKPSIAYNEMFVIPYAKVTFNNTLSAIQNFEIPSQLIFNAIVGFFAINFSIIKVIFIGRILSYILLIISYVRLAKSIDLNILMTVSSYIVFLFYFRHGIGDAGEWFVGGLETKVFAYCFVLLSLSSFIRNNIKWGMIYSGLSLSFHLLVGGYHLFCLIPFFLITQSVDKNFFVKLLKSIPYFLISGFLGLIEAFSSFFLSDQSGIEKVGWDIYVNVRVPHHTVPEFSIKTWLILIIFTVINIIFLKSKNQTKRYLSSYSLFTVVILLIGLLIYYNFDSHYLRYYFFRSSDVILPLITILLFASINRKIQYIFLLIIALNILPTEINRISSHIINLKHNIKEIKNNTSRPGKFNDIKMTKWIKKNLKKESDFIIPPDDLYFWLNTEKSIFVSWCVLPNQEKYKTIKNLPTDMIEWYERLKLINKNNDFNTLDEVKHNYITLNEKEILFINKNYPKYNHILMPNNNRLDFPIIHSTDISTLYEITTEK